MIKLNGCYFGWPKSPYNFFYRVSQFPAIACSNGRGAESLHTIARFTFENGRILEDMRVAYDTYRELNAVPDNAVLVTHGASQGRNGYKIFIGPAKAFERHRDRVPLSGKRSVYLIHCLPLPAESHNFDEATVARSDHFRFSFWPLSAPNLRTVFPAINGEVLNVAFHAYIKESRQNPLWEYAFELRFLVESARWRRGIGRLR